MKNLTLIFVLLCAVCFSGMAFVSCSSDDDENAPSKGKNEVSYVTWTYENGYSDKSLAYTFIGSGKTVLYFSVGFWDEDEEDPQNPPTGLAVPHQMDIYIKDGKNRTLESLKVGEELDILSIYYYEPATIYGYPDPKSKEATIESGKIVIASKDSKGVGLRFEKFKFKAVDTKKSYILNGTANRYVNPYDIF